MSRFEQTTTGPQHADRLEMVLALPDDLCGRRGRELLVVGLAGAFRRSELVQLTVADVHAVDAGLLVTLRRSKTDQEGTHIVKGLPIGTQPETCPKQVLQTWLDSAGITAGPLFRPIDRWGNVGQKALSDVGVVRAVKRG